MVELNGIEHARPALVPSAKRAVRAGVGLGLASEAGGTPPAPPGHGLRPLPTLPRPSLCEGLVLQGCRKCSHAAVFEAERESW